MILAEVIVDGELSTYAQEGFSFLLFVGGALFLLTTMVLGQNSVSSNPSLRKKSAPKDDSLSGPNAKEKLTAEPWLPPAQQSVQPKNKRRSPRRDGNPMPILVADALVPGEPVQGLVLNRSRGGLCLSLPRKVEVGQLLAVRTGSFPESVSSVQLRVRHCKQIGNGWRLGCQFVEDLPWSTVLLFG